MNLRTLSGLLALAVTLVFGCGQGEDRDAEHAAARRERRQQREAAREMAAQQQPAKPRFPPTRNEILEALKAKNPGFADEFQMMPAADGSGLVIGVRDPALRDIGPLAGLALVQLDISQCPVKDLGPLRGTKIVRLHIADAPVTDLSPLEGLRLQRLIFTPARIAKGIEVVRKMETLTELDLEFDPPQHRTRSPAEFWPLFDEGKFK